MSSGRRSMAKTRRPGARPGALGGDRAANRRRHPRARRPAGTASLPEGHGPHLGLGDHAVAVRVARIGPAPRQAGRVVRGSRAR